jgi:hypothetical protein
VARSSWAPARWRRVVRRGSLVVVAGAGAAALLAGCSSSQLAETSEIRSAVQGVSANSADGTIGLRDLSVQFRGESDRTYRKGDTVPLVARITSTGDAGDTLTSVTSPDARHVVLVKPGGSTSPSPSGSPSTSASASASVSPSPGGTSASLPGRATFRVRVPSMGLVELVPPTPGARPTDEYLALAGLTKRAAPLAPGDTVHVVFHFQHAGTIAVDVPLNVPSDASLERSKAPDAS